jgi:hypothetical protein
MKEEYWKNNVPNHIYEFADGCAAQFKGAPSFSDIADTPFELGYTCTRYFFETSHAKGPQDAAGANVKGKVTQIVLNSKGKYPEGISTAREFYDICVSELADKGTTYAYPSDKVRGYVYRWNDNKPRPC